jgi:hypothetical protein
MRKGVGVYKSTDGGKPDPLGGIEFHQPGDPTIAVDNFNDPTGNTIYVTSGRGVHGIFDHRRRGFADPARNARCRRLEVNEWRSDVHATPTQHFVIGRSLARRSNRPWVVSRGNGSGDRSDAPGVIYASAYNVGVWRSTDNGATWTNIHTCQTCGGGASRSDLRSRRRRTAHADVSDRR